jgi:hypothetical protein
MQAIFRVLKQPSVRISLGRESQITAGTFSQLMRALKVALGKDFFDALPSAESLCSAVALGANQVWGLGTPRDKGTWDLVHCALSDSGLSGQSFYWCNRDLLDLNKEMCPFCYNPMTNPISNNWAVFAFWLNLPLEQQNHLLALCASTSSNVTSLAVCADSNWKSETAGWWAAKPRLIVWFCLSTD